MNAETKRPVEVHFLLKKNKSQETVRQTDHFS